MTDEFTLLLVEDDLEYFRRLQKSLQQGAQANFIVKYVNTLQHAIQILAQEQIDIILLDLSLPDSNGFNTFTKINQIATHLPIVILSVLDDEQMALKSVQQGAQDYLVKGQFSEQFLTRTLRFAIERKRIQEKLREREERYSLAAQGSNDGLWDWNIADDHIYFSERWNQMLGHDDAEGGPAPDEWLNRIHPEDYPKVRQAIEAHLAGMTEQLECEYRILYKGGTYHWMLCRGVAIRDSNNVPYRMAGSQTDITRQKIAEQRLRHNALHDTLTGLPNRAYFLKLLEQAVQRAKQDKNYLFGLLFLDLDHFKEINDSYGHQFGDELLNAVAYRLQACMRTGDIVARLGGDEFVVLLEKIESVQMVHDVAERIRATLRLPFDSLDQPIRTSASIGIAVNTHEYERAEDLLHDADKAMYQAKKSGKNRQVLYDTSLFMDVFELPGGMFHQYEH